MQIAPNAKHHYYVTVRNGSQFGLLAGPFGWKLEALASVNAARREACKVDSWAWFYEYGCSEMPNTTKPGVLNDRLGLSE